MIATWCAVWLLVLQAFLAGVATARAGAMLAAGLDGAVICHTSGGTEPAGDAAPDAIKSDAIKAWHLCCAGCTVSALATPPTPDLAAIAFHRAVPLPAPAGFTVVVPHGAIRAGPSQAPPTLA
jgi:DUF2946 family protein